jgi:hypothetical protein
MFLARIRDHVAPLNSVCRTQFAAKQSSGSGNAKRSGLRIPMPVWRRSAQKFRSVEVEGNVPRLKTPR